LAAPDAADKRLSANELLQPDERLVVGDLPGRVLAESRRRRVDRSTAFTAHRPIKSRTSDSARRSASRAVKRVE